MTDRNAQLPPSGPIPRSLADIEAALNARKLPPVDRWDPPHRGHSGMRIDVDGIWYHDGGRIERDALWKLFATVLRREPDGRHVLVTPVEKLDIDVDDAAFVAVELTSEGEGEGRRLGFRLNSDDHVIAGPEHPLRIAAAPDGSPRPYVLIRHGLEALIGRAVFYELAELAIEEGAEPLGLWSDGAFFPLDSA